MTGGHGVASHTTLPILMSGAELPSEKALMEKEFTNLGGQTCEFRK